MSLLYDLMAEAPEEAELILRAFLRDREQCMRIKSELDVGVTEERWLEICETIVRLGDPCDA